MRIGDWDFRVVSGGAFRLDGGGMFGVIPRPLWQRHCPPDERNRIQLEANCLLLQTGDDVVLVDAGNGSKLSDKERDIFDFPAGNPLLENLSAAGVRPEDVTLVLLSHLHMDHVGGATHREGDQVVPSFPRARFVAQRQEWEDAVANRSHMRVSYRSENLAALEASGRLALLDGDAEVVPGLSVRVTGGHTRGHHCIFLQSRGETLFFPADLCPTVAHLRGPWNMGYDMEPYVTMQVKEPLLRQAAREGWVVAFDHEPVQKVVRLQEQDGQLHAVPV